MLSSITMFFQLHIVMHLDKYSNAGEALKNENGLAVLGYLIDVSVLFKTECVYYGFIFKNDLQTVTKIDIVVVYLFSYKCITLRELI